MQKPHCWKTFTFTFGASKLLLLAICNGLPSNIKESSAIFAAMTFVMSPQRICEEHKKGKAGR
jgi:hypothetical protein